MSKTADNPLRSFCILKAQCCQHEEALTSKCADFILLDYYQQWVSFLSYVFFYLEIFLKRKIQSRWANILCYQFSLLKDVILTSIIIHSKHIKWVPPLFQALCEMQRQTETQITRYEARCQRLDHRGEGQTQESPVLEAVFEPGLIGGRVIGGKPFKTMGMAWAKKEY